MSEKPQNTAANDRALVFIAAFLITVVGFLLYYPAIGLPLHGEDQARFVDDTSLHRIPTFTDALAHWPDAPLTVFGYALNWALLPLGGAGLHLANILLHVLCGILLYLLARRLLGGEFPEPVAMLPGLALVLHPLATESLNYLSARPALQATCFALAATLLYLRALDSRTPRPALLATALLLYTCAFASSFTTLGLPLIWLALSRAVSAKNLNPAIPRTANAAALALMLALFLARWATGAGDAIATPQGITETVAAQTQTAAGLRHFIGTHDILAHLSTPGAVSAPGAVILTVLLLLGITAFFGFTFGAPAWWAFIALVSIPCLTDRANAFSEAALYYPLAGLLLLYAVLLQKIPVQGARIAVAGALTLLLAFNGYQTYSRTAQWADPITFWGDTALEHPGAIQPRLYQGRYLMNLAHNFEEDSARQEAFALAKTVWQAAERVDAAHVETLATLGEALHHLGENDDAQEKLEAALHADPFYPGISPLLALGYEKKVQGPTDTATLAKVVAHFKRADRQGELDPAARARYGIALMTLGDAENAQWHLRTAQTADPNLPFQSALATVERRIMETRQLNTQAVQAFHEKPQAVDGVLLRARADLLAGNIKRAFYMLDRTILRFPDNRDAWMLLAVSRAGLGDAPKFIQEYGQKFDRDSEFWAQASVECAALGNWPAAIIYLEHAHQWAEPGTAPPQVQLAGVAIALQQMPVAQRLAEEAARLHPEIPEPWLVLAQIAIFTQNEDAARSHLQEAEKRGAPPETLKNLREQGKLDMDIPKTPVRTIIR